MVARPAQTRRLQIDRKVRIKRRIECRKDFLIALIHVFVKIALTVGTYICRPVQQQHRQLTRPPIATKRLSLDAQGRVLYRYKQPFRDGSTHVVLEPLDFIAKLAALVPRPRLNLRHFHGLFAPKASIVGRSCRAGPWAG